jgi:hypothetical protein
MTTDPGGHEEPIGSRPAAMTALAVGAVLVLVGVLAPLVSGPNGEFVDEETARENTLGNDRIQVLGEREWADHDDEREPSATISPAYVRIPLRSNPHFEGVVTPGQPIVDPGDEVQEGEMVARPASDGISTAQHASIDGEVAEVTDTHVEIRAEDAHIEGRTTPERMLYWTWCLECGTYVVYPEDSGVPSPTRFVCEDCRRP